MHTSTTFTAADYLYRQRNEDHWIQVDFQAVVPDYHELDRVGVVSPCLEDGVLNTAYGGHGFVFSYKEEEVKAVDNADWFNMGHGSAAERSAKTAQHVDPENTLNFYTTNGGGLLGWATFPWDLEGDTAMDGVVVLYSSLPNIGPPPLADKNTTTSNPSEDTADVRGQAT